MLLHKGTGDGIDGSHDVGIVDAEGALTKGIGCVFAGGGEKMEDEEFTESECRKEKGKKKERLSLDAGGDAAWGVGSRPRSAKHGADRIR